MEATMGREVRRVPLDWQHPKDENGRYIPIYDEAYEVAAGAWLAELKTWEDGTHPDLLVDPDLKVRYRFFWDYDGGPPDKESYRQREWTPEEATGYQFYENVSEGTPLSPVFASEQELIDWLVASKGYTPSAATMFVRVGYAPSMVFTGGAVHDGIEAYDHLERR
jgi:hypothetical protein